MYLDTEKQLAELSRINSDSYTYYFTYVPSTKGRPCEHAGEICSSVMQGKGASEENILLNFDLGLFVIKII